SRLSAGRHPVLGDPSFELRRMREYFAHDERIVLAEEVAPTPEPTPFRYTGPVSVPLGRQTLERMIAAVQEDRSGLLVVDLGEEGPATLERAEALGRARLLGADDVVTSLKATHGVRHGTREEFWPAPRRQAARPSPAKAAKPCVSQPSSSRATRSLRSRLGAALRELRA
ncbi:glycosyltransferase family 2 protein, partial [Streptosporangium algeriense]